MQITLTRRLHALAPGLTARSALDKFAAVQMIDVHLPTTDGRKIRLTRYTHPEPELQLLIDGLKLHLPPQPPPRITTADLNQSATVVKTFCKRSKTRGGQGERALARIISGRDATASLPGTANRAPR
jgi:hypothetical protein